MMKRSGCEDAEDNGAHQMELASDKHDELLDATPVPLESTPSGFHRSLGTTNTKATRPPLLHEESFKRISRAPVPFGSLAEAFAYTVFVILFILATTVIDRDPQSFYFANRVRAALIERDFEITLQNGVSHAQKRFIGIQDYNDVWAFLQGPFVDAVYGSNELNLDANGQDTTTSVGMVLSYNRLLGGVRLRTLRVEPDSCAPLTRIPEYASLMPYCYGKFSTSVQATNGYGPIMNSASISASVAFTFASQFFAPKAATKTYSDLQTCYSDCARTCGEHYGVDRARYDAQCTSECGIHCKCIYEQPVGFSLCKDPNPNGAGAAIPTSIYSYNWSDASTTQAPHVTAYTNAYPGSGYVVDLPLDGSVAADTIAQLKQDRYLDLATRALVVDFTVYNAYLELFNLVQLVVEFPATGGVYASCSDTIVDLFQYSMPHGTTRIVLELILAAYVAWRWMRMLQAWYHMGIRTYFVYDSLWHTIQCLHLVLFATVIAFRLYWIDRTYGTLTGAVADALAATAKATESHIPMLHSLAYLQQVDAILNSVNAAFVWLQFLKYTQMSKRMCLLLRMLRRAGMDLVWFFAYFITCILAFAQISFLLFGTQLAAFRTLGASIVTLLQAVAGDLAYDAMVDAHIILGPLFYVGFYLLLLLILLNVFLAILNDAYVQTLAEQEEEDEAEEAALKRSMQEDATQITDDANADIEVQLRRLERRELEQLCKYPFSRGIGPALQLLVADLKRSVYEMRTGRRLFKIDPMVGAMLGATTGAGSAARTGMPVASRKLTLQVKRQLEKQMQVQEVAREAQRQEHEAAQRAVVESQQNELAQRLASLVESNQEKNKRMEDMEGMLGSIEKLCQQLVTAVMEDVPATPKRPTTTAAANRVSLSVKNNAIAAVLQRQKTAGRLNATEGGGTGAEIEEISL
ncbi:hypothetical protein Poli38472_009488 [Pythium oligandrum]|uniref:Polycystin cation channel PKD1/PKD2 domain-containing protein n=1 Tax=Pythium oligandrum TaxID=41045 RepID=A0A8K1FFS7_PYTOL|nr:hypothetical protein Poli38472_009488 [Pythium oligandrum]|eukprot:TMW61995.1 hypothetical protein Poli38472_009488 [Pythium oligandrum]